MAEVKKTNKFVAFFGRIGKFFKDLNSERKKVTWPSFSETTKRTWVVIVVLIAVAILVGLLDVGFSKLIELLADAI